MVGILQEKKGKVLKENYDITIKKFQVKFLFKVLAARCETLLSYTLLEYIRS
jgi:hypothetical protein